MSAYNELKAFLTNSPAIMSANPAFFDFVLEKVTSAQYREIIEISAAEDVLYYLACAYGCYVLSCNHGRQCLITNPEKLFSTENEQKAFVELFVKYVKDELTQVAANNALRRATTK